MMLLNSNSLMYPTTNSTYQTIIAKQIFVNKCIPTFVDNFNGKNVINKTGLKYASLVVAVFVLICVVIVAKILMMMKVVVIYHC